MASWFAQNRHCASGRKFFARIDSLPSSKWVSIFPSIEKKRDTAVVTAILSVSLLEDGD